MTTRTPTQIIASAKKLSELSGYTKITNAEHFISTLVGIKNNPQGAFGERSLNNFDFDSYKRLEERFTLSNDGQLPRGGVISGGKDGPLRLVNVDGQQYLEMDTYGRGCTHDCSYCPVKAELTVHGYWNKPFPMPRDVTAVWELFYTVFETDNHSKWRGLLEERIPLRIGSGSDGLMYMDRKYRITHEVLKLLRYYKYPYIIVTKSDLIAHDDYIEILDKDLADIQIGISSLNDDMNRHLEPGTPSAKRRLKGFEKLNRLGFNTTARVNPLFPTHPDGHFTGGNKSKLTLDCFSLDLVDAVSDVGCKNIMAQFISLNSFSVNHIEKATGIDLRTFFTNRTARDYTYSDTEVQYYYDKIQERCDSKGVNFIKGEPNRMKGCC